MPLVVGHALLGASVVAAFGDLGDRTPEERRRLLLTGAILGGLPDLDLLLTWILGLGIKWHGGFTHSIFVALATGLLAARCTGKVTLHRAGACALAMASHGLLDAAVKKTYGGTQLFWPLWNARVKLGLIDYFAFYPDSRLDPLWKLAVRALQISFYEFLIFGTVFVLVVIVRRQVKSMRSQPAEERKIELWSQD